MIVLSLILSGGLILLSIITLIVLKKKEKSLFSRCNKYLRPVFAILLIALVGVAPFIFTGLISTSRVSGLAEWKDAGNNQQYLYIEADTYYDLGYHEGYQLGPQIISLEILIANMIAGYNYSFFKTEALKYQEFIEPEYLEEMRGMAKGVTARTGMIFTLEDILVQNTYIDTIYGHIYPHMEETDVEIACSVIGVQINNSSMTYGQNFDFPRLLNSKGISEKGYLPGLAFVHTKMAGKAEIFGLRMGGMLNMPCAITSKGIKTFVNIIHTNATGEYLTPVGVLSRQALENANTNMEFAEILLGDMENPKSSCSFNLLIVDDTSILGLQNYPSTYQLYDSPYVSTNRFINKTFNEYCFSKGNYSLDRQEYLDFEVNSIVNTSGDFTEQDLLAILSQRSTETIPAITREDENYAQSITLAFITNSYFGLGNIYDGLGAIPSNFL
ncbi:MAG: C45 family autoproteolytic acyltransferase/hydrolase [Promethearchaeota archaeon]